MLPRRNLLYWLRHKLARALAPDDDSWYKPVSSSTAGLSLHRMAGVGNSGYDPVLAASAVYGCVRVLSGDNAAQPIHVIEDTGAGKHRVQGHPFYDLLRYVPNPEMTAADLRQTWIIGLCLRGNAYTYIERDGYGNPAHLWPLSPDSTKPVRDIVTGTVFYKHRSDDGVEHAVRPEDVLHFKGMSPDGILGLSPIVVAGGSINASIAADATASGAFQGTNQRLFFETDEALTTEARDELSEHYHSKYAGPQNVHKVPFLVSGLKAKSISITPEDMQLLETRRFQNSQIASSIYGVPPFRIGETENTDTFASLDAHQLAYVIYTMLPMNQKIEQELMRKLFTRKERQRFTIEHLMDGLLRADPKTQSEILSTGVMHGRYTLNEIRDMDNRPRWGVLADQPLVPSTMVPLSGMARRESGGSASMANDDGGGE